MNKINKLLIYILTIFLLLASVSAEIYNQNGDYSVEISTLKQTVYNDDINADYAIKIKNNKVLMQKISVEIGSKSGWDITLSNNNFYLNPGEKKTIYLNMQANSNFDYGASVVSPDLLKISQNSNYEGSFDFPITISGTQEDISLNFRVDIQKEEKLNEIYSTQFSKDSVSPQKPLGYTITGQNIEEIQEVEINLEFAGYNFEKKDIFSKENNYKVYQQVIPSAIDPGVYDAKITLRLAKEGVVWEWTDSQKVRVEPYSKLTASENSKKSFFIDTTEIGISNSGNIDEIYEKNVKMNFIKSMLFSTNSNYIETDNGIMFSENIAKGENLLITYRFNYIPLYLLIFIVAIIVGYFYMRHSSNPLDVETDIYEVRKVEHEGIKSMKIRIGFENIKEETIDHLSVIFRMPKYLNIKENSFLLTEPNKVFKGKDQYKLTWEFKNFEANDSRIIGFALMNSKGVLGDIKLPGLEIKATINGKTRSYYKSFSSIKGNN